MTTNSDAAPVCNACGRTLTEPLSAGADGETARYYCDGYCLRAKESDEDDAVAQRVVEIRRQIVGLEDDGVPRTAI